MLRPTARPVLDAIGYHTGSQRTVIVAGFRGALESHARLSSSSRHHEHVVRRAGHARAPQRATRTRLPAGQFRSRRLGVVVTADDLESVVLSAEERSAVIARATHEVTFAIDGLACRVTFEDASAAVAYRARYALNDVAGQSAIHICVARDPSGRWLFVHCDGESKRWRDESCSTDLLICLADAFALTAFFRAVPHLMSMHAAVVGIEGGAAAIVGDSIAGQTTTAVACARRGLRLYSDERLVLSRRQVVPFPRTLTIRPGGIRLLLDAPLNDWVARRLADASAATNVAYGELLGEWSAPPVEPLRSAFIIAAIGSSPYVERIARTHVAQAALARAHCVEIGTDRFTRLLAALEGVACYRLTLGSPHDTADLIENRLRADMRRARAA